MPGVFVPDEVLSDPELTPLHWAFYTLVRRYTFPSGAPMLTEIEYGQKVGWRERNTRYAFAKLVSGGHLIAERDRRGHIEKLVFPRENHPAFDPANEGANEGAMDPANEGATDASYNAHANIAASLREARKEIKDPVVDQDDTGGAETSAVPTQTIQGAPSALAQIQQLWPRLTNDPFDLAWVQGRTNTYGIRKVLEAFQICEERGVHQDNLEGELKAYLIGVCKNKDPGRPRRQGQPARGRHPPSDADYDYSTLTNQEPPR